METTKTKKLINGVNTCVEDNIKGIVAVNTGLRRVKGHRVIVRSDLEQYVASGKVAILTGGGSGHEPAFAGYVGRGMATGAVLGDVFASPSCTEVLAAIRAMGSSNSAGILVLYNNYTGDRLNFGIAVEKARVRGIQVTMATNADDCALVTADRTAGRRGLAGLILMIKIAGALAEEGRSLKEVTEITKAAGNSLGTMGVCLTPCSVPGMGQLFQIDPTCMEIGLGLHGEAGVKTMKLMSAHDTVTTVLDHMTNTSNKVRVDVIEGSEVALLLNNLGATSDLEMNIVVHEAISYLERKGTRVCRCYMNRFATSQEMAGFSITILPLDKEIKQCLDRKAQAVAWVEPLLPDGVLDRLPDSDLDLVDTSDISTEDDIACALVDPATADMIHRALVHVCEVLNDARERLNQLDSGCGDGDCGSTLCQGTAAIQDSLGTLPLQSPSKLFLRLATISESAMGGSSGALYGLFFTAAAPLLVKDNTQASWLAAFKAGMDAIQKYGGAEPGDRTMLDPLSAAYTALHTAPAGITSGDTLKLAAKAAWEGANATSKMRAQAGRASYVSADKWDAPDPGAWAVALCLGALTDVIIEAQS